MPAWPRVQVETEVTFEDGRKGRIEADLAIRDLRRATPCCAGLPRVRRRRAGSASSARRRRHLPALRRRAGAEQGQLRHPRGRDPRDHRPERCRQVVDAQCHQRLLPAAGGRDPLEGPRRRRMTPYLAASSGVARTFQNIALFKGMSTLDNIMSGPAAEDARRLPLAAASASGRRSREELAHRRRVEEIIDFLEIAAYPPHAGGQAALRPAEAGRARPRAGDGARAAAARRADGGHEPRGEGGHVPLHPRGERAVRHHDRADRARYRRGHGPVRPDRRARLRPPDRRRDARRGGAATGP